MAVHPLPPGPWLRFVLYWTDTDTQWQNDIWYKVNSAGAVADLSTVLSDFVSIVTISWLYNIGHTTQLYAIKLYANNGTFTQSRTVYPEATGSTLLGEIPIQVALVGALNSEIATRQANGRIFISGINSEDINGDYPSSSAVTWVNTMLGALGGFVESAAWSFSLAVWDRVRGDLHDVIYSTIATKLGSLRRRRPRV